MRVAALLLIVLIAAPAFAANEKDPAPPPPPTQPPVKAEKADTRWDITPAMLTAIERLRLTPKAGEIMNSGITAGVADVFDVPEAARGNVDKLVAAYDAEQLKLAEKWESELKALRADYEAKIIAEIPEPRRDTAKKLLDLSHEKALMPIDLEQQFTRELIARSNETHERTKNLSPDQQAEGRALLNQWVREQRNKIATEMANAVDSLREILTPEEVQRLEKFNRHRPVNQQPQPETKK
jgi:hypothetical protein